LKPRSLQTSLQAVNGESTLVRYINLGVIS